MKYFLYIFCFIFICGCKNQTYNVGTCLILKDNPSITSIIRLVAIADDSFLVFSHFLSEGKLILAEDYIKISISEIKSKYILIECPSTDDVFSPDKYLNKYLSKKAKQ